jgi:hypothetical protein
MDFDDNDALLLVMARPAFFARPLLALALLPTRLGIAWLPEHRQEAMVLLGVPIRPAEMEQWAWLGQDELVFKLHAEFVGCNLVNIHVRHPLASLFVDLVLTLRQNRPLPKVTSAIRSPGRKNSRATWAIRWSLLEW